MIDDAGMGELFIHRTGHGIGLEGHEDPYMVEGNETPLEAGNAFSIEPGIYVEGRHGARIEDIVVCTADGADRAQPGHARPARRPRLNVDRAMIRAEGRAEMTIDEVHEAHAEAGEVQQGPTAAQLRRFIKSRPYVPLHELRRRFELNGDLDDVSPVDVPDGQRLRRPAATRG